MIWWLWMIAGAAAAVLAFVLFLYVINCIDDRAMAKRRKITNERSDAEQKMQNMVQNAISDMFQATRDYYR
jgi:hypothetical protein